MRRDESLDPSAETPGRSSIRDPWHAPGRISSRLSGDTEAAYSALASPTNGSSFSDAAKNVGARSLATAGSAFSGPNDAGAERLTTAAGADASAVLPMRAAIAPAEDPITITCGDPVRRSASTAGAMSRSTRVPDLEL